MKKICFATTNPGKVSSLQRTLTPYEIEVIPVELELPEPQVIDLKVIATEKVLAAHKHVSQPVIAQDSGFFLPAWGGFPGPFVKFALQTMGLEGLLALGSAKGRQCEFRECLAYYDNTREEPVFFEAVVRGELAEKERGNLPKDAWSELLLVFIPEGSAKTVAEMTTVEREDWRQTRGSSSAEKFAKWFAAERSRAS